MNTDLPFHPRLSRFAGGTALAALLLIGVGGLVTSHEAGMSVPDWPTTFGYNMFLFPISMWTGSVFFEHTHRLFAAAVGLLTVLLALWLLLKEKRGWVRWLGGIALLLVMAQGLLGGLRVTEKMSQLGIVHAALAHLFLVLVSAIALFTSAYWLRFPQRAHGLACPPSLVRAYAAATLLVLCQLVLAATMRHQHAGLVIPDFPTSFGQWWPDLSPEALVRYNQARNLAATPAPITAFQIGLHLAHRAAALSILAVVAWLAWLTRLGLGSRHALAKLTAGWVGLILIQAALGAATVWTEKSPTVATLHVVVGAMPLVAGSLITLIAYRWSSLGKLQLEPLQPASLAPAGSAPQPQPSA